jgi:hypothetical protein
MIGGYPLPYFEMPEYVRVGAPEGNGHDEQGAPDNEEHSPEVHISEKLDADLLLQITILSSFIHKAPAGDL